MDEVDAHAARKDAIRPHIMDEFVEAGFQYNNEDFLDGKYISTWEELGSGNQTRVVSIRSGYFGQRQCFALKVLRLELLSSDPKANTISREVHVSRIATWCRDLEHEAGYLKRTSHIRNVIRLVEEIWPEFNVLLGPPFAGLVLEQMDASLYQLGQSHPEFLTNNAVFGLIKKGIDVLCGLQKLNIIHADIKPSKWLYRTQPNGRGIFKLAGFRHAIEVDEALSDDVGVAGSGATAAFAAPEAFRGRAWTSERHICCRSDLWSMFVCIVWALDAGGMREGLSHGDFTAQEAHHDLIGRLRAVVGMDERLVNWKDIFDDVERRPDAQAVQLQLMIMNLALSE